MSPAAFDASAGSDHFDEDAKYETIKLSPELDHAISSILATKDPLDSSAFDPVEYINLMFPTEKDLELVDPVLGKLQKKIAAMDKEMRELVRSQTDAGERGHKEVEETQAAIKELFNSIKQIREQATASERMVQEITRDIKSLDHAKKNLTCSVTVLRRLQMLVSAVEQLRIMAAKKKYMEASQLVQVINQLLAHFKSYRGVGQIATLLDSVSQLQQDIRKQIFRDFEGGFFGGALRTQIGQLSDACLVINVLEGDARKGLIEWYCETHLKDYRNIFRLNSEVAGLGDVSRRYAWLKRLLKTHDEEHAVIFPPEWKVAETLCDSFCQDTRRDLSDALVKADQSMDVKIMLQALQKTMEFEGNLEKRFGRRNLEQEGLPAEDGQPHKSSKYYKVISSVFDPYLRHYIEMEDKALSNIMADYRTRPVLQEEEAVLSSSTDLFYLYRQTLVQCAKFSTNKPFLDLVRLFGKWLKQYGDLLQAKLPKDDKKHLTEDDIRTICLIINTGDYCTTTTSQLEEKLAEKIDEEFRPLVNFNRERDGFLDVSTAGIKMLVHGIETTLEPAMTAMVKRPWGALEAVGDQSDYVTMIAQSLGTTVAIVKRTFASNTKYFRAFCDKFSESFLTRYYNNITRCKPISEVGAEQMLLDTQAIKNIFIQMANINSEGQSHAPAIYLKIVSKAITKVEQLLKVVLRPYQPVEGIVETYLLLFSDHSVTNFQKVLDLKGLKRTEQQTVLEAFQRRAATDGTQAFTPTDALSGRGGEAAAASATSFANVKTSVNQSASATGAKIESGFRKFVAGLNTKRN
ncbi:Vacuolar protein sorting-associated protein 53 [Geranomyces variabilis]|uniref:Vacuolar protein sorting-associated protein 53 n=1 Tax=Geranomyces variabilis TaxID=109894 RepID=A0AAD5TLE4_9FUNG|nr:Vacuolar protein sorting-associated protein 53 [Geranomyces variabilis]